jgi:small-conductance mechanosensitive channel
VRGRAIDDLLTSIYKRFRAEGIVIPFPQRDVHIIQQ